MLDVKKLLAKVLNKTEFKTLLWTNPSGGTFGAQTVSLDLSHYDAVEVEFYNSSYDSDLLIPNPTVVKKGIAGGVLFVHALFTATANENTGGRKVSMTSTGVTFSNYTYKNRRTGGSLTTANQFCVPKKIYGITIVGGVVSRLFNTLKMLTSERGWAVC